MPCPWLLEGFIPSAQVALRKEAHGVHGAMRTAGAELGWGRNGRTRFRAGLLAGGQAQALAPKGRARNHQVRAASHLRWEGHRLCVCVWGGGLTETGT